MRYGSLLALGLLLGACGGGGGSSPAPPPPPAPAPTGLLIPAADEATLTAAVRRGFERQLDGRETGTAQGVPPGAELDSGDGSQAFTTTYRLEDSVDEHDVVRYDGRHLFIAPSRGHGCCFAVEPPAIADSALLPPPPPQGPRAIRILATDPDTATVSEVGTVSLEEERSVEGLYAGDDLLTALTSTAWWGYHGDAFAAVEPWTAQRAGVAIYDVSSPATPSLLWELAIEGALVASRRIGATVYLITRHSPVVEDLITNPGNDADRANNMAALEALSPAQILPQLQINGEATTALGAGDCWVLDTGHEKAPPTAGHPVITTIVAIDLEARALRDAVCYTEPADGVYLSPSALYLSQTVYAQAGPPETIVHRFDLEAPLTYAGSGRVRGYLAGNQVDFRMSEAAGYLRLVTSEWRDDASDRFEHFLHVLSRAAAAPELEPVATLPSAERPAPLGKPDEDLYGVRFLRDRAYLVTFERIDPLYVIDLADPTAPRIAGELEIPGFSDLLHPVGEKLLLGVGQDTEGAVKVELFDVADPALPRSLGASVPAADAGWSYSQARYDRRAFTYLARDGAPDRLALPVSAWFPDGDGREDRLYLFEVRDAGNAAGATLADVGYLAAVPQPADNFGGERHRSVLHQDAVFYVNGDYVWSARWQNPGVSQGPH